MSNDENRQEDIPINMGETPSVVLELIYRLKIKDVMTRAVITAKKTDTLRHIQAIMRENFISGVPVVEGLQLLGVVSMEDIIKALDQGFINDTAEKRMTKKLIVLEENMPLSFAISYLNKYHYRRFPVLNTKQELVGILNSKDVVRTLLVEMNREVLRLEKLQQKEAVTHGDVVNMSFKTNHYDFKLAGHASAEIKKTLKQYNLDPAIIRRVSIASYELEINQVVHSNGGVISCSIQPDRIIIIAEDTGPGIADVEVALQEGWSTANEWVRSLGFGAGMGLANTRRVSNEFVIESELGKGTMVKSVVFLNNDTKESL